MKPTNRTLGEKIIFHKQIEVKKEFGSLKFYLILPQSLPKENVRQVQVSIKYLFTLKCFTE